MIHIYNLEHLSGMSSRFRDLSVIGLFSLPAEGATARTRTETRWVKRPHLRPVRCAVTAQGYKGVAVVRDCFKVYSICVNKYRLCVKKVSNAILPGPRPATPA